MVVEAYKTDGYRLHWRSSDILEICYAHAHIYKFRNIAEFWSREQSEDMPVNIKLIEVVLRRVESLDSC